MYCHEYQQIPYPFAAEREHEQTERRRNTLSPSEFQRNGENMPDNNEHAEKVTREVGH